MIKFGTYIVEDNRVTIDSKTSAKEIDAILKKYPKLAKYVDDSKTNSSDAEISSKPKVTKPRAKRQSTAKK